MMIVALRSNVWPCDGNTRKSVFRLFSVFTDSLDEEPLEMNPTELKQSLGPPNMTPKADSRTTDFLFQEFHLPDVTTYKPAGQR